MGSLQSEPPRKPQGPEVGLKVLCYGGEGDLGMEVKVMKAKESHGMLLQKEG